MQGFIIPSVESGPPRASRISASIRQGDKESNAKTRALVLFRDSPLQSASSVAIQRSWPYRYRRGCRHPALRANLQPAGTAQNSGTSRDADAFDTRRPTRMLRSGPVRGPFPLLVLSLWHRESRSFRESGKISGAASTAWALGLSDPESGLYPTTCRNPATPAGEISPHPCGGSSNAAWPRNPPNATIPRAICIASCAR
jgi:hypothetical protein